MSTIEALITELRSQGIVHPLVLEAIQKVPRDQFVLDEYKNQAYDNTALPITCHQTISQPYIVALMTQALLQHPTPQKILEIGTGSGYQCAILAEIFEAVYSVERIQALYLTAKTKLTNKYDNIYLKLGDGSKGWDEYAPYDGMLVTACVPIIPAQLIQQLSSDHGTLIIPVGEPHGIQRLTQLTKHNDNIETRTLEMVSFVPLIPES